ncbi:hypothetical protein [Streptomyces sp. NPDC088752]|uniref:hypothetical protein n=1 Tax=Streptomyces sp. NPDC088752 TaxID=3154963 RepID=UPI003440580A
MSVLRSLIKRTPDLGIIHGTMLAAPDLVADTAGTARRGITRLTGSSSGMRADAAIAVLRLNPDMDTGHRKTLCSAERKPHLKKIDYKGVHRTDQDRDYWSKNSGQHRLDSTSAHIDPKRFGFWVVGGV